MKIAILGGTGKLGLALARRFHRSGHQTKIGSREIAKAVEAAKSIDPMSLLTCSSQADSARPTS